MISNASGGRAYRDEMIGSIILNLFFFVAVELVSGKNIRVWFVWILGK